MLSEFLLRFRTVGVPGAAGAPAVPAEALDAELAPVFALLAASEGIADAIAADARLKAGSARAAAEAQSRLLVADANSNAATAQATEADLWFARADVTCATLRTKAADEVARIDAAVPQRLAPLIAEVVALVLARAGAIAPQ